MTTVLATCPLCRGTRVQRRWEGTGEWSSSADQAFLCTTTARVRPEILECESCRHLFSNPEQWPTDLGQEYEVLEDHEYLRMLPIKRKTFRRAADVLGRYVAPPASVLEVGAYAGLFLAECRRRGYRVVGVEPSKWGARVAAESGLDVRAGTAQELLADGALGTFDAVVSWDVLEHVEDPAAFMGLLSKHVLPGGTVIISTLDRTNWFARLMGKRWPWLIPMHLHYFDQASVIEMARRHGFEFVATAAHVHYTSAGYALQRLLGHGDTIDDGERRSLLERIVFPVGFGDVRLFVFRAATSWPT